MSAVNAGRLFAVFEVSQAVFVNLRNPDKGANIFAVLLTRFQQILDIPVGELQVHGKRFEPFVDRHYFPSLPSPH